MLQGLRNGTFLPDAPGSAAVLADKLIGICEDLRTAEEKLRQVEHELQRVKEELALAQQKPRLERREAKKTAILSPEQIRILLDTLGIPSLLDAQIYIQVKSGRNEILVSLDKPLKEYQHLVKMGLMAHVTTCQRAKGFSRLEVTQRGLEVLGVIARQEQESQE